MNKTLATAKKFIADHKVAITVAVTTSACVAIHRLALTQHNDFLKEHGLYEEFYAQID